jgi:hypothetical protein
MLNIYQHIWTRAIVIVDERYAYEFGNNYTLIDEHCTIRQAKDLVYELADDETEIIWERK